MKSILIVTVSLLVTFQANASSQTECNLPSDQGRGSLLASWENLPITLVFDEEFYKGNKGEDANALKRAVKTWNDWAQLKGKTAFLIANENSGLPIPKITGCSQAEYTEASPTMVGIWKISDNGDHKNKRASCGSSEKILSEVPGQTDMILQEGKIRAASILVNMEDFNSPGKPTKDLQSIVAHELGHVLGLLHSCNGSEGNNVDSTSAPLCAVAPEAYQNALMSPNSADKAIREMTENDFNRVNCLY